MNGRDAQGADDYNEQPNGRTTSSSSFADDEAVETEGINNQQTFGTDEQKRRITSLNITSRIKEELHKAGHGQQTSEKTIERIFAQLQQSSIGVENVESIRTLRTDGEAVDHLMQLSVTQVEALKSESAHSFDPGRFISFLKTKTLGNREPGDPANGLLPVVRFFNKSPLLGRVPNKLCLRPCFELKNEAPHLRPKAERKRNIRVQSESHCQVVRGKTLREMKYEDLGDEEGIQNSVNKELDNVRRHLRRFYKQNSCNEVEYYRFVLHPDNFGETVENMFHVSFLIKDGQVRLQINPRTGCPSLVKLSREDMAKRFHAQQIEQQIATHQIVPRLDYTTWQRMVRELGIKNPMIVRGAQ